MLVLIAVMVVVLVLLTPPFVQRLGSAGPGALHYADKVRSWLNEFWTHYGNANTKDVQQSVNQLVSTLSGVGVKLSSQLATKLSTGLMSSAFSFVNGLGIMLLARPRILVRQGLPNDRKEFSTIAGPRHEQGFSVLLAVMSRSMGGYMRGTVFASVFDGVIHVRLPPLIRHPYTGLSAILVGVPAHHIPVIGEWIAVAFAVLVAIFDNPMLALRDARRLHQSSRTLTDNVVSPLIMRSAVVLRRWPIASRASSSATAWAASWA